MDTIKKLLNSNWLIILVYLVTVICWFFQVQNIAMGFYIIIAISIILFGAKRINIIALIMAGIINYRDDTFEANVWLFVSAVAIVSPFLIYDLIKNKIHYRDNIFLSMLMLLAASILSLINTNSDTFYDGLIGVLQIAAFAIMVLYFTNKDDKDNHLYVAKNAVALAVAIAIEFAIYIMVYDGDFLGKNIDFGWGISNSIAITLTMLIPLIIYLYTVKQKTYLLLIAVFEVLIIILTLSKGAYITLALMTIPLSIYTFKIVEDRIRFIYDILISIAIVLIVTIILSNIDLIRVGFLKYLDKMDERGWFNDKGRLKIYKVGFNIFKQYPLFGAGSYTARYYLAIEGFKISTYHNYIIHTLATTGLVGLFAFGLYIYNIIKSILHTKASYNIYILLVAIGLSIHGLVDNTWFSPIMMVIMSIYLSSLVKEENELQI